MTKLVVAFRNPANARKKKLRNLRTSPKAVWLNRTAEQSYARWKIAQIRIMKFRFFFH
jgi:hypothetical protein